MFDQDDVTLEVVLEEVMRRAALDPEFRALALTDATAAIQRFMPDVAPGSLSVSVSFVESDGNSSVQLMAEGSDGGRTYVLPAPMWELTELIEAELEEVAGGQCTYSCVYSTCGQNSCVAVSVCNNCCGLTCPFTCFCGTNGGCCLTCVLTWS